MERPLVFISWSKPRSKQLAEIVHWWLGEALQSITPWYSHEGIEAGSRPLSEIEVSLSSAAFGIICVTPENENEPWLNFEAGAISKAVKGDERRVVPLLLDFSDPAELTTPIKQFQGVLATQEGFLSLALSVNSSIGDSYRLEATRITAACNRLWPELDVKLKALPKKPSHVKLPERSQLDLTREAVNILRELDSKVDFIAARQTPTVIHSDSPRQHSSEMSAAKRRYLEDELLSRNNRESRRIDRDDALLQLADSLSSYLSPENFELSTKGHRIEICLIKPLSKEERRNVDQLIAPFMENYIVRVVQKKPETNDQNSDLSFLSRSAPIEGNKRSF